MSDPNLIPKSKHRRVENTEDFTNWEWGEALDWSFPPDEILEPLKEWTDGIAGDAHTKGCADGAAIAFEELAREGFFVLRGITDKGLLVEFMGTDQFVICDELDIVTEAIEHFEDDPQRISAHLRRLADAIDAGTQEEHPPLNHPKGIP